MKLSSLLALAGIVCAQRLSPDEVRVSSKPYVPQASFRTETDVVEIAVVVRDSGGRAVPGLARENFRIQDNGVDREITGFIVDSATPPPPDSAASTPDAHPAPAAIPRFIALYFDDINSQDGQDASDLKRTQDAAQKFVQTAVTPGVRMGVFTASGAPLLEFTSDQAKIIGAIRKIQPHPHLSESGLARCPKISPYLAYLIAVRHDDQAVAEAAYQTSNDLQCSGVPASAIREQADATWRQSRDLAQETLESIGAVADRLASASGRRLLLVASSGFFAATLEDQRDQIVNRALRAGVVISALDSKGLAGNASMIQSVPLTGPPSRVRAGVRSTDFNMPHIGLRADTMDDPLSVLAEETGGSFFHNSNNLSAGFAEAANPPAVTYRLSFRPGDIAADAGYHKLKITLLSARGQVQARQGYFAPPPPSAASRADAEVTAADTISDFPVQLTGETARLANGETNLTLLAKVDISKLNFRRQGDRMKQTIRFLSALLDQHGTVIAAKEATMDLSLKPATYQRLLNTGLNAKLTLQAGPGAYRLREVVEETAGHKLNCSTNPVKLP
ncbi:MAG TPA: VWA domain-containing protein [Bryobacteraceae bacterium]|nr:VWA domain-containing protein [Bryobacteraceae bacterium]